MEFFKKICNGSKKLEKIFGSERTKKAPRRVLFLEAPQEALSFT
jgi:hypothetical protein